MNDEVKAVKPKKKAKQEYTLEVLKRCNITGEKTEKIGAIIKTTDKEIAQKFIDSKAVRIIL